VKKLDNITLASIKNNNYQIRIWSTVSVREIISFYLTEVGTYTLLKSNSIVFTQWLVQIVLTFFHQKSELMYKYNKYIWSFYESPII